MYANIVFFWHIDVYVTFSRGQILLEIHDPIAMRTQTWVGKKCDAFTRVNSVPNSRCHCYDDTNFEWEKFTMLSRVVLGTYSCTLLSTWIVWCAAAISPHNGTGKSWNLTSTFSCEFSTFVRAICSVDKVVWFEIALVLDTILNGVEERFELWTQL